LLSQDFIFLIIKFHHGKTGDEIWQFYLSTPYIPIVISYSVQGFLATASVDSGIKGTELPGKKYT